MKLKKRGSNISEVEVLNVSPFGIWIHVRGKESFLPYDQYPWFRDATLSAVYHVELFHENHLHWPELDIDLDVNAIKHPEKYSLIYT